MFFPWNQLDASLCPFLHMDIIFCTARLRVSCRWCWAVLFLYSFHILAGLLFCEVGISRQRSTFPGVLLCSIYWWWSHVLKARYSHLLLWSVRLILHPLQVICYFWISLRLFLLRLGIVGSLPLFLHFAVRLDGFDGFGFRCHCCCYLIIRQNVLSTDQGLLSCCLWCFHLSLTL